MEYLQEIPFSLTTLSVCFALPFVYFLYQTKYWYRPDILKNLDFILQGVSIIMLGVLLVKLVELKDAPREYVHLVILHCISPALTMLIVSRTRLERWVKGQKSQTQPKTNTQPNQQEQTPVELFKPVAAGSHIEQLTWDHVVISQDLKEELNATIELLRDPREARKYGIEVPKGMLFYGPPGTGKTTIAKVIANTAGLSFYALKMNEVVSKWVGESEKNLSALFDSAQRHAPAVIFIDEIDAIGRSRSGSAHQWAENLLNHLLQQIDGVSKTEGLYVIGATNRVELVDAALKRSGRLNKVIEIPMPDFGARVQLFSLYLARLNLAPQVSLQELAGITKGCSGADIKEICNQAGLNAFKRESHDKKREYVVQIDDLRFALQEFRANQPEKGDIHTAQRYEKSA